MKAGTAKSRPEWRSQRGTHGGKQMKAGAAKHAGRQMKAGAAKSRPEWRSRRETHEGRNSQEQARMEITKGDT